MIGYFSRQALHVRRGNGGQATALFLVVAATLLTMVFASIYVHNVGVAQVACSNAVDAVALNAATWEARCLNMIAALNDGINQCLRVIRWICVVWAALAVAAACGVGAAAFAAYTKYARRVISGYWKTAQQLAKWSEQIRKAAPYLVLGETIALAKKRAVVGILSPPDPRGSHDAKNTLELHLEPGPPIYITDAVAPISSALNRIRKNHFLKKAARGVADLLGKALGAVLGGNTSPIRMLVPEKDFQRMQFVRFSGSRAVPRIPIPFLDRNEEDRVSAQARAQPYGGGSAEMTWKSRLTEVEAK